MRTRALKFLYMVHFVIPFPGDAGGVPGSAAKVHLGGVVYSPAEGFMHKKVKKTIFFPAKTFLWMFC